MPSYEPIARPEACPKAFLSDSPGASVSQAAFFLMLGAQLHPEWGRALDAVRTLQEEFPLPAVDPLKEKLAFPRHFGSLRFEEEWPFFQERHDEWRGHAAKAAEELYHQASPEAIARSLELGVLSPDPLVRVAALITAIDHVAHPRPFLGRLMYDQMLARRQEQALVADIAGAAIGRLLEPMRSVETGGSEHGGMGRNAEKTLLLINGTMLPGASIHTGMPETWWRPDGDLHKYLRTGKRPDIYSQPDFYEWEGGYSLYAHEVAAKNLCEWQKHHDQYELDIVTHSHGGNMVMLATQFGLKVNRLVFLSCPVHWSLRQPNFANVRSLQSVRIKHDLVLMADRAAQEFTDSRIPEDILPYWFISHSYSHQSTKWAKHGLDRYV